VVVCAVPWARHEALFTRTFEDQTAWLAINCSQTAVPRADADCVAHRGRDLRPRSPQPRRSAICSPACAGSGWMRSRTAKGQRYLIVVVHHDTGRLV
jgi:transposase